MDAMPIQSPNRTEERIQVINIVLKVEDMGTKGGEMGGQDATLEPHAWADLREIDAVLSVIILLSGISLTKDCKEP